MAASEVKGTAEATGGAATLVFLTIYLFLEVLDCSLNWPLSYVDYIYVINESWLVARNTAVHGLNNGVDVSLINL